MSPGHLQPWRRHGCPLIHPARKHSVEAGKVGLQAAVAADVGRAAVQAAAEAVNAVERHGITVQPRLSSNSIVGRSACSTTAVRSSSISTFIEIQLLTAPGRGRALRTEGGAGTMRQPLAANRLDIAVDARALGVDQHQARADRHQVVSICIGVGSRKRSRWIRKSGPS